MGGWGRGLLLLLGRPQPAVAQHPVHRHGPDPGAPGRVHNSIDLAEILLHARWHLAHLVRRQSGRELVKWGGALYDLLPHANVSQAPLHQPRILVIWSAIDCRVIEQLVGITVAWNHAFRKAVVHKRYPTSRGGLPAVDRPTISVHLVMRHTPGHPVSIWTNVH